MNKGLASFIKLDNPEIIQFYDSNTFIDYEKANLLLIEIFQKCINYEKKSEESFNTEKITNGKYIINNNHIEAHLEQNLEIILNKINLTSEIIQNTNNEICGDYIIVTPNKVNIIIENKTIKTNVSLSIVKFFENSCKTQKVNGILISQHSGIIGKQNFEIDFIDSNVIIYIHKAEYNEDKIQMAIDIINKIHNKILILNTDNNITILPDILCEIKNEYQQFVTQKEEFKSNIKIVNTQIIQQIDNMKLCNLDDYLSTKFTQLDKKYLHKCNLCNFYTSNTLKGMAAHKRGCKKKFGEPES